MKRRKSNETGLTNNKDINEMLDKLLQLQEGDKEPSFLKKTVYVVTGICVILFVILICASIYKNSFTTESILSTFLAFFSIFISIFFYFKADETSTNFYNSSYAFMKDISVTLGKIEERFGEKLNSLNDKVSHLDRLSKEASQEIEDKQEDKDSIINELMEKANLNEEQKAKYKKELEEKEKEIEVLREHKYRAERDAIRLRRQIRDINVERSHLPSQLSSDVLLELMATGKIPDGVTLKTLSLLRKYGYVDSDGNANNELIIRDLNAREII